MTFQSEDSSFVIVKNPGPVKIERIPSIWIKSLAMPSIF
jgi:hypothetical protein